MLLFLNLVVLSLILYVKSKFELQQLIEKFRLEHFLMFYFLLYDAENR